MRTVRPWQGACGTLLVACGGRTGLEGPTVSASDASADTSVNDSSVLLAVGGTQTYYRSSDGTLFVWGANWDGVLNTDAGVDGDVGVAHPTPVVAPTFGYAVAIRPMPAGNCILYRSGDVGCWGWNGLGGVDGIESLPKPPPGVVVVKNATSIAGQRSHCARLMDNSVQCWGYPLPCEGTFGVYPPQPPHRRMDLESLDTLSLGDDGACGLVGTTVRCCGSNAHGDLGDGTTVSRNTLGTVPQPTKAESVSYGFVTTPCALMLDSTVECWGWNALGQIGDGMLGGIRTQPTRVIGLANVTRITDGGLHNCALLTDHTARCWGNNANGQLGDGTTTHRATPVPVLSPTGASGWQVAEIQAGGEFTCAIDLVGKVWCWGRNQYGQLGDGTTANRSLPTQVTGLP